MATLIDILQTVSVLAVLTNLLLTPRRHPVPLRASTSARSALLWAAFALGVVARWLSLPVALVSVAQLACLAGGAWLAWTSRTHLERPLTR